MSHFLTIWKISYRKEDKYLVLAWKNKRVVTMLSTWHNRDTKEACTKTAKKGRSLSEACYCDRLITLLRCKGWTEQTTTVPAMGS
jgi:hypothetical protein